MMSLCRSWRNGGILCRDWFLQALVGWPFEGNHRNFAGCLLLILSVRRKDFCGPCKRMFTFFTCKNTCSGLKFLRSNLNGNFWMGQQVEIPIGMARVSTFGCNRQDAVTILNKHQGGNTRLACFGSSRCQ